MKKHLRVIILIFSFGLLINSRVISQINISSGFSVNVTSIDLYNIITQRLEKNSSAKIALDLNILFTLKIDSLFSIKYGIYSHPEYFKYTRYHDFYEGSHPILIYTEETKIRNIDFPLLICFTDRRQAFSLSAGPYLGIQFDEGTSLPLRFSPVELGMDLSAGIGSAKWKFTGYCLISCKNLLASQSVDDTRGFHEKARSSSMGFNLTRTLKIHK